MTESDSSVTLLLSKVRTGNEDAREDLYRAVEKELRQIAEAHMRRERPDHTLQPMALIDDAFMQLTESHDDYPWENRVQFYRAAARAMRCVLIDHERRRRAMKRGGGLKRMPIDVDKIGNEHFKLDLLALDEALTRLAQVDPRQAEIVELHHFGGRTLDETARVFGLSTSMVKKEWAAAKAWLYRELRRGEEQP